jgi:hypothetical protein
MSKIVNSLEPVWSCTPQTKQECFELLSRHFDGVTWRQFNADFHEKQYVAVLRTEGHLVGFSTMVTLPITTAEGTSLHIAFSGDTAVEFAARKSIGFGTTLSSFFRENISTYGDGKVWYVLISKGWRTYKAMEFMFHSFTPHPSREMSTMERSIIAAFGKKRYPLRFNEATGVLSNLDGDQKLKGGSPDLDVPDTKLGCFFKEKNPNFAGGDELICLARLSYDNFTTRFKRCFR